MKLSQLYFALAAAPLHAAATELASLEYELAVDLSNLKDDGLVVEFSGVTSSGCKCKTMWEIPNYATCADMCCNPDNDPRGDWCIVDDPSCVDQAPSGSSEQWGYCTFVERPLVNVDGKFQPSDGTEDDSELEDVNPIDSALKISGFTTNGCACMDEWSIQGYATCTDTCCNPDDDPRGAWCVVADKACMDQVTNGVGQQWGYCEILDDTGTVGGSPANGNNTTVIVLAAVVGVLVLVVGALLYVRSTRAKQNVHVNETTAGDAHKDIQPSFSSGV